MKKELKSLLDNPEKLLEMLATKADVTRDLDAGELALISKILCELRDSGDSPVLNMLYEVDYVKMPPTIEEFLDDDYYLGSVCRSDKENDYDGMFPRWRRAVSEVFAPNSSINQIILGGSIGCVDADTEYLTPTGWHKVSEYTGGVVAQFNPETKQSEFVQPSEYVKRPCDSFLHFKTKYGVDQMLSDEHRVYYKTKKSWRIKSALDIANAHNASRYGFSGKFNTTFLPPSSQGKLDISDQCLRVMVAVIADGSFNYNHINSCMVNVKKQRKVLRMRRLLTDASIPWTEPKAPEGYTRLFFKAPIHTKTFKDFWGASPHQLKVIADELFHWDGSVSRQEFYTCNEHSANFAQYALTCQSKRSRVLQTSREGRTEYVVTCSDNVLVSLQGTPKTPIERKPSPDGFKYCFEVPTSLLIFRRNGNIFITGNTGKTMTGVICTLYKLAICLCLRNPLLYYGLARGTHITCSIFSITQAQVKRGAFQDMLNIMRLSPFFCEKAKANIKDKAFADRVIPMHNDLQIEAGSKVHEAIGRNTLIALIDEINFRIEANAQEAAYKLISAIDRRLKSRFKRGNRNPGLLTLISSANQETDFLVRHIEEQRKVKTTAVFTFPQWEVLDGVKFNLCGQYFRVDVGDSIHPPKILEESEIASEGARIIDVPEEYRDQFDTNLEDSIKDIAGISTGSVLKFFSNMKPLLDSLSDDFTNPFTVDEIPMSVGAEIQIKDFMILKDYFIQRGDQVYPKRHPSAPRFIHIDMSTGAMDALAIVCIHPVGTTQVNTRNRVSQRKEAILKPTFEVDFALRIIRSSHIKEPIDIGEVRMFIYWLKLQNVPIKLVSADLFNMSSESLSILKQLGFETKYVSIDRTKEPYKTLRQVFGERRIKTFLSDYMFLELVNLEDHDKKIDHPAEFTQRWDIAGRKVQPKIGSKDLADALCGAVYGAEQSEECYTLPPMEEFIERMQAVSPTSTVRQQNFGEAPRDTVPVL
jgi:hypothetical protein